jgi:hypothetical protein
MSWLPSPEYADWWYDLSWKGVIGFGAVAAFATAATMVFAVLQFWSHGVRDQRAEERSKSIEIQLGEANARAAKSSERVAELELARAKVEARQPSRTLTQTQQGELTRKLSGFKDVRGTIVASPSTPESEMFASALLGPLNAAGWSITLARAGPDTAILHPKGVVVQYPMDIARVTIRKGGRLTAPPGPWDPLVDALNEAGIAAAALPWPMQAPNNIAIVINEK